MSQKWDPNQFEPKDHFSASENPKESKVDFYHGRETNESKAKSSGFRPPFSNPLKGKTEKKAGKTLSVLVLGAATAASGVVGYVAVTQSAYVDVNLTAKGANMLAFEVKAHNFPETDLLIAELYDGAELLQSMDLSNGGFLPFYELEESREYRLGILQYADALAEADEPSAKEPVSIFSRTYRTAAYSGEAGIEILNYEDGMLDFSVYAEGNYPFLTTKVSDGGKVYLSNDWNGAEKSYHLENIPTDAFLTVTVEAAGNNLAYILLEPQGDGPEPEPQPVYSLTLLGDPYISYHSVSATFEATMDNPEESFDASLMTVVCDFKDVTESAIAYREGGNTFSFYMDDLEPNTSYTATFLDEYGRVCHEYEFQTEDTISITQTADTLTATMSPSFYAEKGQNEQPLGFTLMDEYDAVPAFGFFEGTDSATSDLRSPYFGEQYTLQFGIINDDGFVTEPILNKTVTLEGPARPEFSFAYEPSSKAVTITQVSGDYLVDPTGAGYNAYFYCEKENPDPEASVSENIYDNEVVDIYFSADNPSADINLASGTLVGQETPGYSLNVIVGTYEVSIIFNDMTIFQGNFIVE